MKRPLPLVIVALLMWVFSIKSGQAQATCGDASNSRILPTVTAVNTAEHTGTGLHSFGLSTLAKCTYSHGGTATCDVTCQIDPVGATSLDPLGNFIVVETGPPINGGTHDISGGWVTGLGQGFGSGTSCTGQMVAGASNCGALGTKCILGVTVTPAGASITTAPGSTVIWQSPTASIPVTCAAVADPQATPTPPPPPPPDAPPPDCPDSSDNPTPICFHHSCPVGCPSPIIIDLTGDGFQLTSAANGVKFDIGNTGTPIQIAWTANANNAFLVLDRDGNGIITNGSELFGNFTPQPQSAHPNGFAALAVYDQADHGGNGDGIIDARDQIFSSLRLWVDANHDGICQPGELHTLPEMGVFAISLDYSLSSRVDQFGNLFRYRARINQAISGKDIDVGKQAYDVFFVTR